LFATYGLLDVVGHDDIAPARKTDPGPAFPMDSLRGYLVGRKEDGPAEEVAERYRTTTTLNVRKGPAVSFDTVSGSPLAKGREVEIVADDGAWRHVVTPDAGVEGWVHGKFLVRA